MTVDVICNTVGYRSTANRSGTATLPGAGTYRVRLGDLVGPPVNVR